MAGLRREARLIAKRLHALGRRKAGMFSRIWHVVTVTVRRKGRHAVKRGGVLVDVKRWEGRPGYDAPLFNRYMGIHDHARGRSREQRRRQG